MSRALPALLIGAGSLCAAAGIGLGVKAGVEIADSHQRIESARSRQDDAVEVLQRRESVTNDALLALRGEQERCIRTVVHRMVAFLRKHEKAVSSHERLLVDGARAGASPVATDAAVIVDALAWAQGGVRSLMAGASVNAGLTKAVHELGRASTGTPIRKLAGAAEVNARLAAFGGGSKAIGGGGKQLGKGALATAVIGPALLTMGLVAAVEGERAKTRASANEAAVEGAVGDMRQLELELQALATRAAELSQILLELEIRGVRALEALESVEFDPDAHATLFRNAFDFAKAVGEVASTSLHESAGAGDGSGDIVIKYRAMVEEDRHE